MASFVQSLSFSFLLVLFSTLQIEASDRLFFNRVTRSNNNYSAEDPKLPLSYEQEAKPFAALPTQTQKVVVALPKESSFTSSQQDAENFGVLPTQTQKVAVDPPKESRFTRNQYGEYGLFGSSDDSSAAIDTSSSSNNEKNKTNNNYGDNFIYNMETDSNSNGADNTADEIKQQGLNYTRSGNEGYDNESVKQNEFDYLEEYQKYLQRNGYLP